MRLISRTPPLRVAPLLAVLAVLAILAVPATEATEYQGHSVPQDEELVYDWHLGGFVGAVAGLFLPNHGQGVLSVAPSDDGMLSTELMITSPEGEEGEHWRYGSLITREEGYAREAWNTYQWRDKSEDERATIEEPKVRDIVSGIYQIRRELPQTSHHMRIWSDGKIYPVIVIPKGEDVRKINGSKVRTRHYKVRGFRSDDGRYWKGNLEIWLARDAAATPVEMHIERSLANLRLQLQELP